MKLIINITVLSLAVLLLGAGGFSFVEPGLVDAQSADTAVTVSLAVTSEISIASTGNTIMSTNLGVAQNTAVGTTTWTVITNDSAGYTLGFRASTNPAMQSGSNTIDDYSTTTVPGLWSVTNGAKFGFSATGTDVSTATWGTGDFCNGAGTSTIPTSLKYFGFYTNSYTAASRSSTTTPAGVRTTTCYAVEQNNTFIPSGIYTATITGTATGQ